MDPSGQDLSDHHIGGGYVGNFLAHLFEHKLQVTWGGGVIIMSAADEGQAIVRIGMTGWVS